MRRNQGFSRAEWLQVLERNDIDNVSQKRLKDSIISGVPEDLRGRIWILLTKAEQLALRFNSDVFPKLCRQVEPSVRLQISKDLGRTFPEHAMFREKNGEGQRVLMNVLSAYANYDPEIGYCQGMSFIAGGLILQLQSEEPCFWTFVQIMYELNWRILYKDGFPRLDRLLAFIERDLEDEFPEIAAQFRKEDFSVMTCFTHYILTIFMSSAPLDVAPRIFDMFLFEGERMVKALILKMISLKKRHILQLRGTHLYNYLKHELVKDCFAEYSVATLFSPIEADEDSD